MTLTRKSNSGARASSGLARSLSAAAPRTMDRRTFTLDAKATLDAFFRKDFTFLDETSFIAPRAAVTATGPLTAPKFAAVTSSSRINSRTTTKSSSASPAARCARSCARRA